MSTHYNPRLLMVKTNSELAEIYQASNVGISTGFELEDIQKEIAYRKILNEWFEDGCGHDLATQNDDNYNEPDYELNSQDND